ncbi:DNA (cytosine-5-)-methyltransferase [Bacteroides sp. BFG-551]|nr:DNA (cytosine-5-)-methyltransferase [Bacteroides sp. BFG-551]
MDGQAYVPQHRERIMIVGFNREIFHGKEQFCFPEQKQSTRGIREILEPDVDDKYTLSDKLWSYLQNYAEKHRVKGNGFGFGMVDLNGISRTLSARYYKDGSEILVPQGNGKNPRRLSPRECARLMGYPDKYRLDQVSDVQAYRQCGNSVVVPLITAVSEQIIKTINNYEQHSDSAIQSVQQSKAAWCRFITGNDTGATGSHQAGFYIPKCASSLLFDEPGKKGENKEKTVQIKWQDDFTTESCMKYYGQGTRNEYRITRFGRGFPFFQDDNVGDLLIIAKYTEEDYLGYVLSADEDIDGFFAYFNLAPDETNQLIDVAGVIKPGRKNSATLP